MDTLAGNGLQTQSMALSYVLNLQFLIHVMKVPAFLMQYRLLGFDNFTKIFLQFFLIFDF
jgi:hypothetical protein